METDVTTDKPDLSQQGDGHQQDVELDSHGDVDYKAKYLAEIENAKKQRARAQDAESKLDGIKTNQEKAKQEQLKEQGKFKEIAEGLQQKVDILEPIANKWTEFETSERERLLNLLPEEHRSKAESLDNGNLEFLVNSVTAKEIVEDQNPSPQAPSASPSSQIRGETMKNFTKMSDEERKANWDEIMSGYLKS